MVKNYLFIILIITFLLLSGCGLNEKNKINDVTGHEKQLTIEEIINKHIPKPYNPIVRQSTFEYHGKTKGNIMPVLTQEIEKQGWKQFERWGAKIFYKKTINRQEIKIYVLPIEKGNPRNKEITTFVIFELDKR